MSRVARRGNVRAIRPGIAIPTSTDDHRRAHQDAQIVAIWQKQAHDLAQTAPNSEAHLLALHPRTSPLRRPLSPARFHSAPPLSHRNRVRTSAWTLPFSPAAHRQHAGEHHHLRHPGCEQRPGSHYNPPHQSSPDTRVTRRAG